MSDTAPQKSQQYHSSGSGHTAVSRHPNISDPIASKHVCFYKSGDPQFSGLKLVINSRTFKTFDALLDSLSKKVPLPFGVRNITTPRGVHAVKTLEELQDGQSYICSDQKKVKPINLKMARKKLPPWYGARPVSARRQAIQLARQKMGRSARQGSPLGMWTPKRLVAFKNGDPSMKHTILLHKKTTQTFEALLDYMCEIMQFPVVKLYTADGRRVDGLPALILCSGAVVAAGREPFKAGNYDFLKPSLSTRLPATSSHVITNTLQPKSRKKKSQTSSLKSRNFSLSSEKYFVNQIQNSIMESMYDLPTGSLEMDPNTARGSVEEETCTCPGDLGEEHHLVPLDDDIEKSFRVNQDGSMTVEMKVRLTIKEEETVHWSTTLTRSSVTNQLNTACLTQPEQGSCSSDSSSIKSKDNNGLGGDGYEENNTLPNENWPICKEVEDKTHDAGSEAWQPTSRRVPTPGPRSIRMKQASVESINMKTETGIQENVIGTYSYTEETVEGKVTEECCIVRQCNSKPIPKPRNFGSMEINNNKLQSTVNRSGVSEIQHMREHEIAETVLHIYKQQSCHNTFFANTQFSARSQCESVHGRPASTDTGLYSASNDFELDPRRPFTASESLSGRRAETLSLSSEPMVPSCKNSNNLITDYNIQTIFNSERECAGPNHGKDKESPVSQNFDKVKRKPIKPKEKQSSHSSLSPYKKKQKEHNRDTLNKSKKEKTDIPSPTDSEKQAEKSSEQKSGKLKNKRIGNGGGSGSVKNSELPESMFPLTSEHLNSLTSEMGLSQIEEKSVRDQQVDKPFNQEDLPLRKNVLDLSPPIESTHIRQVMTMQKSMNEDMSGGQELKELNESLSLPGPHSSSSVVNEYVEHWLKKSHPQPTPYMEDTNSIQDNIEARVVFQIRNKEHTFPEVNKTRHEAHRPNTEEYYGGDPTIETAEMESDGTPGEKQRHCIPSESVQMKPALTLFTHKSTEHLDIRHMLEKLSLSIQEIKQISEHRQPSCMEKSHSLPDFSSHVASIFGSSPQALLAFLSVMTLKEGISNTKNNGPLANNASCIEALKMMESLKKIASIEYADELKARLSDLQNSTSSQLLQSWKSFLELSDKAQNHRLSSNCGHELSFITCQNQSYRNEEQPFDIQELVEEHTNTKVKEELLALVNKQTSDVNMSEDLVEKSAESDLGESINDLKESHVEEMTINFIESNFEQEVGDYVKSIIKNSTSALLVDAGSTVRVYTTKAEFSASQQAEISKDPEGCTEEPVDQEKKPGHEEDHYIYEEGTNRYAEQPLYYDEKQDNFFQHSAKQSSYKDKQDNNDEQQGSHTKGHFCYVEENQPFCEEDQVNKNTPQVHATHSTEGSNQLNLVTEEAMMEEKCDWNNVSQSVKIIEELNNSMLPAPSASCLAFSYDCKGSLKRESEGTRVKSIRDLFLARSNEHVQYGHKRIPSPNTSDLSDYRSETSDSRGNRSQGSPDTSTESGEDYSGRRSISRGYVRRTIEKLYGRNDAGGKQPPSAAKAKKKNSPGSNSVGSLTAFHEAKAKVITDLSYFNATSLYTTCDERTLCTALNTNVDTKEGVLIEKGRWLLKDNHLIRKSPPEHSAMQENGNSMSVENEPGHASDAAPYSHFGGDNPPLAVILSPELDDPGKIAESNCTYFSLPHGSDSELFQDDVNIKNKNCTKAAKKYFQPASDEPKACVGNNGSLTSVEFKKIDNKVHPQSGPPVVVTQPGRAQGASNSKAVQEQDPLEMLFLMCGQHCPIL